MFFATVFVFTIFFIAQTAVSVAAQRDCELVRSQGVPGNEYRVECDGIRYIIVATAACAINNVSCPLLFDTHGWSMDGDGQARGSNLRTLGYERGYVVVNPEKPNRSWNPSSDHPKVFDFYQQVISTYDINRNRTHFTGFSQGGLQTWDAGCNIGNFVCSIAPLASSVLDSWGLPASEDCWSTSPQSPGLPPRIPDILYTSGHKDRLAPFENAEERRDDILQLYGRTYQQGVVISQDNSHIRTRWTRAGGNEVFEFLEHNWFAYGIVGHCFPTKQDENSGDGPFVCGSTIAEYNWGELVLDFFDAHPC